MVAIEYHCPICKSGHRGRFFKTPDDDDLMKYQSASEALGRSHAMYIPDEEIPPGDETDRLHRWGYGRYRQLLP
jgi:adenine-specific DNA methylase